MYFEQLLPRVYSLDKPVEIIKSRFVKYSMIGGASALVDWGLFYAFAIINLLGEKTSLLDLMD